MNHFKKKLVSIILPFYNREKVLRNAILSVLKQTVKEFELIIINDGSNDKSDDVVKSFSYDKRIIYVSYRDNKGANYARNIGLKISQGKYITFIDSDIIYYPDKLEMQLNFFSENLEVDINYCRYEYIKEHNSIIRPEYENVFNGYIYKKLIIRNFIDLSSVMIKRKCLFKKNGKMELFNEKLPRLQDYEFFLRLSKNNRFVFLENILYRSFYLNDSITSNESYYYIANDFIERKYRSKFIDYSIRNILLENKIRQFILYGYSDTGKEVYDHALKLNVKIIGVFDKNMNIDDNSHYVDLFNQKNIERLNEYPIIIASKGFFVEIENELRKSGYKIIFSIF